MNNHVTHQIPDYVLNLLPRLEQQAVEQHTAVCSHCQRTLQAEREVGQMVRFTLQTATQPANGRLAQFMPAVPSHKQHKSFTMMGWQRQLAVVTLLVVIVMGSFGMWNGRSQNIWGVASPTATSTLDATATIAQQQTIQAAETLAAETLGGTAVASPTIQAYITATPAPQPTPVAAIASSMTTN
ncbi:MAG: zf-HC2 domain-containing protein [Anaerolineae bacterium]|nr:zf-HC2 domain-containing protein [Anaerolineae bacterium]